MEVGFLVGAVPLVGAGVVEPAAMFRAVPGVKEEDELLPT